MQGGIAALDHAAAKLGEVGGYHGNESGPVIPPTLRHGDMRLSMFAAMAQFSTPEDVTLDDLKIELYYPMDAATADIFSKMANA